MLCVLVHLRWFKACPPSPCEAHVDWSPPVSVTELPQSPNTPFPHHSFSRCFWDPGCYGYSHYRLPSSSLDGCPSWLCWWPLCPTLPLLQLLPLCGLGVILPSSSEGSTHWDKPSGKWSLAIQHGEDCRGILQGFKCVQGNFPGSQVFSQHAICTTFGASNNKIGNKQKSQDLKVPNRTKSKNSSLNINQTGRKFIESKSI